MIKLHSYRYSPAPQNFTKATVQHSVFSTESVVTPGSIFYLRNVPLGVEIVCPHLLALALISLNKLLQHKVRVEEQEYEIVVDWTAVLMPQMTP